MEYDLTYNFKILEEEAPLPMCDYMFNYVIGFGSGILEDRKMTKLSEDGLNWKVDYKFRNPESDRVKEISKPYIEKYT